jgi:hypothetical protein
VENILFLVKHIKVFQKYFLSRKRKPIPFLTSLFLKEGFVQSFMFRFWEFVVLSFKFVDFPCSMGLMSLDVVLFITWKVS